MVTKMEKSNNKVLYRQKGSFKGFLFIVGLILIGVFLLYTQHLVNTLEEKSREYLRFRIRIFEENINSPSTDQDFGFFFTEVIQGTDYPIIYTDTLMAPQFCKNLGSALDTLRILTRADSGILSTRVKSMDRENQPIPITYQGLKLGYYHYGVSPVIEKLRWLPYIEIIAFMLFVLIGYIGFSQIKSSEQRNIWVGMSKETAHQLGTPISSLNGWIEILKEEPEKLEQILPEIEIDTRRLTKIASRFSQIGSMPAVKLRPIVPILRNAVIYYRKRLPKLNKKVFIKEDFTYEASININSELFEWVIENLIKNALDAIEGQDGEIILSVRQSADQRFVYIDVKDNGKGINPRDKQNVFKPGFSTKTRGWGLGLSLAKRIIEDYHKGKLFIKETRLGEGTTFRISFENVRSTAENM
jgi:anti-sigma regulatory factor (Ser/Thr protein kinase)